jgi:hypothetical protein
MPQTARTTGIDCRNMYRASAGIHAGKQHASKHTASTTHENVRVQENDCGGRRMQGLPQRVQSTANYTLLRVSVVSVRPCASLERAQSFGAMHMVGVQRRVS